MADKDNKNGNKKKSNSKGKKQSENKINQKNQFWAILLFALGILLLFIALVEGTAGWSAMHNALMGVFGISGFVVPLIIIFLAVSLAQNTPRELIVRRLCESILGILLISGFVQIFFFADILDDNNTKNTFSALIKQIYINSQSLHGGGVAGTLIGLSLLSVFGKTGSRIIMLIAIAVVLMFLTNTSLLGVIDILKTPFIRIKEAFDELTFNDPSDDENVIPEDVGVSKHKKKSSLNPPKKEKSAVLQSSVENPTQDEEKVSISELATKALDKVKQKLTETLFEEVEDEDEGEEEILDTFFNDNSNPQPEETSESVDSIDIEIPLEDDVTSTTENSNSDSVEYFHDYVKPTPQVGNEIVLEDTQLELVDDTSNNNATNTSKPKVAYKYKYPSTELLEVGVSHSDSKVSKEELETTANKLIETLESFQARATVVGISRGPAVTRYEVQPQSGIKVSKITGLADDIALNLATSGVRMEAPIPGKSAIGVEVPNKTTDTVSIRELLESDTFKSAKKKSKLSFVVGKDIAGNVIVGDIAKMPHVIIAGATGSGKSVCTNSIIMSILYNATPDEVKFILIDPKIVEFQHYSGIPHLLIPVVTDPKKATGALNWAVQEMLKRYQLFADNKVKDLGGYNQKVEETGIGEKLPQIVIAIDELADLMMVAKGDVEEAICRLAQMARAAGMHLIIATQRPTVDIITGLIKANIPSRIALSVMSAIDSRTIIDINGAEKLLGHGDMLYFPTGMQKPLRVQGCWVSPKDIENTVNFVKQDFEAEYSDNIMEEIEKAVPIEKGSKRGSASSSVSFDNETIPNSDEELVERAIDLIMENNLASTSMLQRRLKLGYARAGRIMDEVCEMGIVSEAKGSKPRDILITKEQWAEMKLNGKNEDN